MPTPNPAFTPAHLTRLPRACVALCVVALGVMAAPALAQRGGGGASQAVIGQPAPTLRASDVARVDPIVMLLARRTPLALTDSQAQKLVALETELLARNAPALRSLDSVLAVMRAHAADTTGSPGTRLMQAGDDRSAFTAVLGHIRDNDDDAAQQALALFSGAQLRRVYNVIRQQRTMMGVIVRGGVVPQDRLPPSSVHDSRDNS